MQKSLAPFLLRSRFGSDGRGRGPRYTLQGRGKKRDTGGVARGVSLSEPHADHSGQAIRAAGLSFAATSPPLSWRCVTRCFLERCVVRIVFQGDTEEFASSFSIATLFLRIGELKQL